LDRLAPVREVAQIGACIGREFSYELLSAVSPLTDDELEQALEQLTKTGLIFRRGTIPDATYTFKHALVQDAAYDSLLKSKRGQLHAQIAKILEKDFSDTSVSQAELLAYHFTQAGLNESAIPYWVKAGQRSLAKTALPEAVGHLSKALEVVQTISPSLERDQTELQIRISLARAQLGFVGWASSDIPQTLVPARELAERLGNNQYLFETLNLLQVYYISVPVVEMAREYAQRVLTLGLATQDQSVIVKGHVACAMAECVAGNWNEAKEHGDSALRLYDLKRDAARMSALLVWAPHWYWALGLPEQAAGASVQAVEIAKHTGRPFDLVWALTGGSSGLIHTGDTQRALDWNRKAREIAHDHAMGFAETTPCNFWGGPALIADGQYAEGYEMATFGGTNWEATGGRTQSPYLHTCRAFALGMLGRAEEGVDLALSTLKFTRDSNHRTWEPITLVVLGRLLWKAHKPGDARLREANDVLDEALQICRSKGAKGFELIAATSLAHLNQTQGKTREAYELLAPICGWFTEGFDTRDLREARALLENLSVSATDPGASPSDAAR
jgi:tetratricopeptide (TPR) repeat protein